MRTSGLMEMAQTVSGSNGQNVMDAGGNAIKYKTI